MGAILSLFSGIWGYVASALAAAALAGWLVHTFDDDAYQKLKNADAQAAIKAVQAAQSIQKKMDDANLTAAVDEAEAQQKIVTQTQTVTKEITVHVPDSVPCVPAGFIRMLDTAAGVGQDTAGIARGQSDDACQSISWRELASQLADDYGIGNQNAEQLNALEANIRSLATASQGAAQGDKLMDSGGH